MTTPNTVRWWEASAKGDRPTMEDRYCVFQCPNSNWIAFCILDGHGGVAVADLASKNFPNLVCEITDRIGNSSTLMQRARSIEYSIQKTVLNFDHMLADMIRGRDARTSGSTFAMALFHPAHRYVIFAHLGDSRCLLRFQNGQDSSWQLVATNDHKPDDPAERKRVKEAGGFVVDHRVDGILAMSRALGDFSLKIHRLESVDPHARGRVSSFPDVSMFRIPETSEATLVLACDGVFDVMSNEQTFQFLSEQKEKKACGNEHGPKCTQKTNGKKHWFQRLISLVCSETSSSERKTRPHREQNKNEKMCPSRSPAEQLVRAAYAMGSTDNISVLVVEIPPVQRKTPSTPPKAS